MKGAFTRTVDSSGSFFWIALFRFFLEISSHNLLHLFEYFIYTFKDVSREEGPRIDIREEREPLVDVMESEGEIKVIAEIPGVEKREI